jgi:hypothetical protein
VLDRNGLFAFPNDSFGNRCALRKAAQRIEFAVVPLAPGLPGGHITRPLCDVGRTVCETKHRNSRTALYRAPDLERDLLAPGGRTARGGCRASVDGEIDFD